MKAAARLVNPVFCIGNRDYGLILMAVPGTGYYAVRSFVAGHVGLELLSPSKEVMSKLLTFAAALANNPHSTVDEEDVVSLVAFFNSNI